MILILKNKYFVLIILILFQTFNLSSKDYLINLQAKVVNNDKHNYSEGNNFNLLKLDGSFTDNLGNYGNWNALASFELNNNKLLKQSENNFIYTGCQILNKTIFKKYSFKELNNFRFNIFAIIMHITTALGSPSILTPRQK